MSFVPPAAVALHIEQSAAVRAAQEAPVLAAATPPPAATLTQGAPTADTDEAILQPTVKHPLSVEQAVAVRDSQAAPVAPHAASSAQRETAAAVASPPAATSARADVTVPVTAPPSAVSAGAKQAAHDANFVDEAVSRAKVLNPHTDESTAAPIRKVCCGVAKRVPHTVSSLFALLSPVQAVSIKTFFGQLRKHIADQLVKNIFLSLAFMAAALFVVYQLLFGPPPAWEAILRSCVKGAMPIEAPRCDGLVPRPMLDAKLLQLLRPEDDLKST